MIELHRRSINVELQQRSCEYFNMFLRPDSNELRATLLERMPAADEIDEVPYLLLPPTTPYTLITPSITS